MLYNLEETHILLSVNLAEQTDRLIGPKWNMEWGNKVPSTTSTQGLHFKHIDNFHLIYI